MADTLTSEQRSLRMSLIRSKDTAPELRVRRLAHALGFRFRLHVKGMPGTPDIVLPRLRSVIEVRGCFWHMHAACRDGHIPLSRTGYWLPKLARNRQRDRQSARKLRSLGWRVLVIWECQTKDVDKLNRRLVRFLSGK